MASPVSMRCAERRSIQDCLTSASARSIDATSSDFCSSSDVSWRDFVTAMAKPIDFSSPGPSSTTLRTAAMGS